MVNSSNHFKRKAKMTEEQVPANRWANNASRGRSYRRGGRGRGRDSQPNSLPKQRPKPHVWQRLQPAESCDDNHQMLEVQPPNQANEAANASKMVMVNDEAKLQHPAKHEDVLLDDEFATGFEDELEAIFGSTFPINMVSVLPYSFVANSHENKSKIIDEEASDIDSQWVQIGLNTVETRVCKAEFEQPAEDMKEHLKPLYIKANVEGKIINKVLIDGGAAVSLVPRHMLKKLDRQEAEVLPHNMVITDFNGKSSSSDGVILLNIKVGSVLRSTLCIVVPSKASFNLLLCRDWIHAVGAVPSTVHQKMILWNEEGVIEVINADETLHYVQNHFADIKLLVDKIKSKKPEKAAGECSHQLDPEDEQLLLENIFQNAEDNL